jgi:hypothetical protein
MFKCERSSGEKQQNRLFCLLIRFVWRDLICEWRGCELGSEQICRADLNSSLLSNRSTGCKRIPAVVGNPPVMAVATLRCTMRRRLVIATGPLDILLSASLYTLVYQTSAPCENIGKATVFYSCFVPAVKTPLADLASRPISIEQRRKM